MHQKTVFLLVANQQDLTLKISWADSLHKSYQNSKVLIILISNAHNFAKENYPDYIDIVHYPSNRHIEPHILIIQVAKLNPEKHVYYLQELPTEVFRILNREKNEFLKPLISANKAIGALIYCDLLVKHLKLEIQTSNLLRQLIST